MLISNAVVITEIKLKQNKKPNAKQCFVSVKLFDFSFVSACLHVKQNAETKQK